MSGQPQYLNTNDEEYRWPPFRKKGYHLNSEILGTIKKTWKTCKTHLWVFMCMVLVLYVGTHSEIETGWAAEGTLQTPAPFSQILSHS